MSRNIARAKQQFSEVIRLAAETPRMIYNRDRCVAAVVDAEPFKAFDVWRKQSARKTLGEEFAELRQIGGRSPLRKLTHCRRCRVRRSIARMPSLPCWKTAGKRRRMRVLLDTNIISELGRPRAASSAARPTCSSPPRRKCMR